LHITGVSIHWRLMNGLQYALQSPPQGIIYYRIVYSHSQAPDYLGIILLLDDYGDPEELLESAGQPSLLLGGQGHGYLDHGPLRAAPRPFQFLVDRSGTFYGLAQLFQLFTYGFYLAALLGDLQKSLHVLASFPIATHSVNLLRLILGQLFYIGNRRIY